MKKKISAGNFDEWLKNLRKSIKSKSGINVPCGNCRGCCTSALFVHINEKEKETIKQIPEKYLFKAPYLPSGNFVLGYNSKGHCPMFDGKKCTIYEFRPITCRMFDCRIFAATGLFFENKNIINKRINQWKFNYLNKYDREKRNQIKKQAKLLKENGNALNEIEIALKAIKNNARKTKQRKT